MNARLTESLPALRRLRDRFRNQPPTAAEVASEAEAWDWARTPGDDELLALCTLRGEPIGVFAPRWLAHLTGMPHCTAHVALAAPSGFVILQRRSAAKAQFPNCWDMTVTGHVSVPPDPDPEPVTYFEAATRELEEEMGIPVAEHAELIEAPGIVTIGTPTAYSGEREDGPRPWYDVEVRQLFGAILTPTGLARLSYPEEEISSILLCRPEEALRLTSGPDAAAGACASVREFTQWLRARVE